jgi:Homeodomain-like domain
MTEMLLGQGSPRGLDPWGERMLAPDAVASMVQLHRLGWGTKRIAGELGCSRNTVKRYLAAGGWAAIRQPRRRRCLDELADWLKERFRQHRGNCDVVRQDLVREHGVTVSLRTVERAVAPLRQALRAEARACLRFETPPGKQLQIDSGAITVPIGGTAVRVHLFVATWATRGGRLSGPSGTSDGRRVPALRRGPPGGGLRQSAGAGRSS